MLCVSKSIQPPAQLGATGAQLAGKAHVSCEMFIACVLSLSWGSVLPQAELSEDGGHSDDESDDDDDAAEREQLLVDFLCLMRSSMASRQEGCSAFLVT